MSGIPPGARPVATTGTAQAGAAPDGKPLRIVRLTNPRQAEAIVFSGEKLSGQPVEPQIEPKTNGYSIRLQIPGLATRPEVQAGEVFAQLDIPGWSSLQEIGKPAVPLKIIMLPIPRGVKPEVQLTVLARAQIGPISVWPTQPPFPDVSPEPPRPPFQRDQALYASDEKFPAQNLLSYSVGNLRNRRLLTIEVTPVQVCAQSRVALVAEQMELTVTYAPEVPGEAGGGALERGEDLPEGFVQGTPGKYMILMDDQFTNNATLAEFVDWKRRKGYNVTILKTSDIDPGGAPTNGQIVSYLRGLPAGSYPEYLLIIGDQTAANGVEGKYFSTSDGGWTDLDLACRDAADFLPDLYHGRLPAVNNTHLTTMLTKVLLMDRNPPTNAFYQRVCVAGMIQDSDDLNNVADRLFCETADLVACFFEQDAGGVDYTCERALVNPSGVTSNCLWNPSSILWNSADRIGLRVWQHFTDGTTAKNRIINNINSGVALVQHRDHGYSGGYGWADPYFTHTQVKALTNGVKFPVVFSINCASGAYHQDRFLRAWFQNTNGGAYAVFAPVDISYSWLNDWLTHGFYTAFLTNYISFQNNCTTPDWSKSLTQPGGAYGASGSARRLGEILNFGKMYMREKYSSHQTTFRLFHLFGDPEAFIQLLTPATQNVQHVSSLSVGAGTVTISNLEANAQVCLYSAPLGIQQVTNAAGGAVTFALAPANTGVIHVTVTRYGARPYEGTLTVAGAAIGFGAAQYAVNENGGAVWVTVTRSGDTNLAASVDFATSNGTAAAGADYAATNGTLSFPAGVVSNGFSVTVNDDGEPEGYETINLRLTNPSAGAAVGAQGVSAIRIEDNDSAGLLGLSAATFSVSESNAAAVIPVGRAGGAAGTVSVTFSAVAGTAQAGADFTATNGTLTFAPGVTNASFSVPLLADYQDEADETVLIALGNPTGGAALLAPTSAVLTIVDDDTAGTLSLASATAEVSETNTELRVWVRRTGGSDGVVTVAFATSNGTAAAGSDYLATNGTLTLAHGQASNSFRVAITNVPDGIANETFQVRLSSAGGGATLGTPAAATVTVWDAAAFVHEGFEGHALPAGWVQEYVVNSSDWRYQTGGGMGGACPATAHGGSYNACMFDFTSTDDKTRLIAPPVNFGPYTTAELTFWHCMQEWAPNQDELRVYYKTSAGGAWNLLAGYSTNVAGWTKRTISLPDLGATYYVAFEGNARRGNGICLDDVLIMGAGTNPPPDLSAPSVPAGLFMLARTTNSVTIGWGASTDNVGVVGYKVYRNGAQVGNVAGLSFTNQGLTPGCGYTNQVRAYDAAGNTSALSAALAVFPLQAVTITLQPQSCTNKAGSAVNFLVGANGTAPICYQWQKDGVNVPGATNALYSIAAVPAGAAGGYRCLVSNVVGVVTSATATLTVHSAPVITSQPVAQSVAEGQAVLFSVGVSGTAPFGFQWRKDDAGLVGAVASNYQIAAAAAGHAGAYYCVVTNVAGAVTSQAAILTVNAVVTNTAPTITLQPQSATVNPGAAVAFSVTAGGSAPLAYQWQKNGTSIFGANSSRYAIKAAAQAHEGAYRCLVQNAAGVATSAVATLTVNDPPAITSQPQPQRVRRGAPASFTLTATGLAPLTYQWRKDGVVLDGAITPQYTLAAAERSDAGGYDCVVQNALGAVTSVVARLTIKACNGDLDGDGLADPWLVRDSRWYCWPSAQGYQRTGPCELGIAGTPVVADFDGDGRADLAMVTGAGQWYLWYSAAAYRLDGPYELGLAGLPVAEDVDGDGKADPALLRDNRWYLWMSAADYLRDGPYDLDQVGTPLLGDFDGDGKADPALITGDGTWYVWGSDFEYRLGGPSALGVGGTPLCGDFDGDGLADPVIIDAEGYWHVWWSSNLYQHAGPYVLP